MRAPRAPEDRAFTGLIPVHGADDAAHFVAAMRSLAAQTLAPAEILICQDGPLPGPLDAAVGGSLAEFGARRVVNPGPRGLQHNLNHALREVRTPFVARADADDVNLTHRFEAQLRFLRENPQVSAMGGAIVEFFPDGRSRRKSMPLTHDEIVRWARWRNPINHMTAFFALDAVLDCGGYPDVPLKQDYALWLAMIAKGALLANLADDLVRARLGETFHRRRAGLHNLSSELALFRLKRTIPRIGAAASAAALVGRSCALALEGPARLVYEWGLRR